MSAATDYKGRPLYVTAPRDVLYRQQAEYLAGIARLHGPMLADYMDAYSEHITLNGESWMSADAVREAREELVAELVREYVA